MAELFRKSSRQSLTLHCNFVGESSEYYMFVLPPEIQLSPRLVDFKPVNHIVTWA